PEIRAIEKIPAAPDGHAHPKRSDRAVQPVYAVETGTLAHLFGLQAGVHAGPPGRETAGPPAGAPGGGYGAFHPPGRAAALAPPGGGDGVRPLVGAGTGVL